MSGVYRKEMRSFRTTMIGYVFIAFLLAVIGIYFSFTNLNLSSPRFEALFENIQFVFLVVVPIITMRTMAEERRTRTDQLLFTLPLRTMEIVGGKYLALVSLFGGAMLIVCFYPLILLRFGQINLRAAYLSILGFFLLGCADLAIGLFCSSLTESPVIAAVLSFGTLLILFLMNTIARMVPNTAAGSLVAFLVCIAALALAVYAKLRKVLPSILLWLIASLIPALLFLADRTKLEGSFQRFLSLFYMNGRLTGFYEGILDIPAIIYYGTVIVIALTLTWAVLTRNGLYSLLMTLLVITACVEVNLIIGRLPSGMTEKDVSTWKLYSLTDTTKEYLKGLQGEVELYYICEGGEEDDTLERLLGRYEEESPFISVTEVDPVLYPGFVSRYSDKKLSDNSVIVVQGERSRVVAAEDLYTIGTSPVTGRYMETGFDGEGLLTSAIDYVAGGSTPVLYRTQANGENPLPAAFSEAAARSNIEIRTLNLLSEEIPQDAAGLILNAPSKDYSGEEADKICAYLEKGGNALILSNYSMEPMPNLDRILADYGMQRLDGIILEGDPSRYVSYQYCLLPFVGYHEITQDMQDGVYLLTPMAQGILPTDKYRGSIEQIQLLTTSTASYNKADVQNMTTAEKESGDTDGPFTVGMLAEEDIDSDGQPDTEVVYYSTGYLLDEDYNRSVSGTNAELFADTISFLCRTAQAAAMVPIKSMQVDYLMLTDRDANFWTVVCVFLFPLCFIAAGTVIWYRRRKR